MDKRHPYPDHHPYLFARASLAYASNVAEKLQIQPQRAKNTLSHKGQKNTLSHKGHYTIRHKCQSCSGLPKWAGIPLDLLRRW